jgi:L-fuconolactonase
MSKHKDGRDETILEPDLVIIDTHHHLFNRPNLRYLFEDYLEDVYAGHKVMASVYVEANAMLRPDGPEWLRPIGEVEFANGVAAMSASGGFGPCRVAAAIVCHADMTMGDRVAQTLDRALSVAPDRLRGVRQIAMAHPDERVMSFLGNRPPPDLLKHPGFAPALRQLAQRGLSFDATVLHHQLPDLGAVAAAHPDTSIVLDHIGLALSMYQDAQGRAEVFRVWRESIRDLARRPNVTCKIGGLGTLYWDFGFDRRPGPTGYLELAGAWRPYVETAIEAFGVERCMMESDFPPDGRSCGFVPLWNALKYIVGDCTAAEKAALFHGTAARIYRIELAQFKEMVWT